MRWPGKDPANHNHPKERQLDFFGGLRWRFEEHVPPARRRIDRIALFKAKPGLTAAAGFHLQRRRIQHLRLCLAPQHHHRRLFVPHGQGAEDQSGVHV